MLYDYFLTLPLEVSGNLEFTLHSSQIVILPKPLWYYGFLFLHLCSRPLSNTKHIGAIILLNRVRILMIQVDVSLTPGASQFVHFLLVARSSITHYTLSMKSLTLVSLVSILIQYNEKLPIFYRDIYTSDNCHLQQQLDCLVRSDIFGRYKSCLGLGEDKPLLYLLIFLTGPCAVYRFLQGHISDHASSVLAIWDL